MTNNELKAAVADKLADSGIWINKHLAMRIMCQKAADHSGIKRGSSETMYAYLMRYVGVKQRQAPMARTPRTLSIDRVLTLNFERASQDQPPMMTPNGVGNGAERQHGYGRGA